MKKKILAKAICAMVMMTGNDALTNDSSHPALGRSLHSLGLHNTLHGNRADTTGSPNSGSAVLSWHESMRAVGGCEPLGCGTTEGRQLLDATGLCLANYLDGRVETVGDEHCESVADSIGSRVKYEYCEVEYVPCEGVGTPSPPPTEPAPPTEPTYSCPAGYSLMGALCYRVVATTKEATPGEITWSCRDGGPPYVTDAGGAFCIIYDPEAEYNIRTVSAIRHTEYHCPDGWTLDGYVCHGVETHVIPATEEI